MIHRICTPKRRCTRHLARPRAGGTCGPLTKADLLALRDQARSRRRRARGIVQALGEQLADVIEQRDNLRGQVERVERAYEHADHQPPCLTTLFEIARGCR